MSLDRFENMKCCSVEYSMKGSENDGYYLQLCERHDAMLKPAPTANATGAYRVELDRVVFPNGDSIQASEPAMWCRFLNSAYLAGQAAQKAKDAGIIRGFESKLWTLDELIRAIEESK